MPEIHQKRKVDNGKNIDFPDKMYYNIKGIVPIRMEAFSVEKKTLEFEEVTDAELFADYTAECSGSRSDCCTRVCTRKCDDYAATEAEWGKFLAVEGGVIQY